MEQEQQLQSIFNFSFDDTSREQIKAIGLWARINAILAFIGLAIGIVAFVMAYQNAYSYYSPSMANGFGLAATGVGAFLKLVQVVISIILNVFLYLASGQLKKGVETMDNGQLTKGFASLRTYYKMYGIVLIVMLILLVLLILFLSTYRRVMY